MPPFSDQHPYPSQREPVYARNCVATSQPLAAQAGLEMLAKGGNAFDAIVATAMCLTVVEPTSNGIGADAFCLAWVGGGLHGLNASGRSPALLTQSEVKSRFAGMKSIPYYGWGGVTTPGAVSAWVTLAEQHCTMPMINLAEPAIRYARDGFLVSPQTAYYWARGAKAYDPAKFPDWHKTFAPSGEPPRTGERIRLPDHGDTLQSIAETNGKSFYEGELAEKMDAAARAQGGLLRKADLAAHRADWVRPVTLDYKGMTLHEIPPNGQGITACIALGILKHFDLTRFEPDSVECQHLQIEAMKLAFRDAHRFIADPAFMDTTPDALLDPDYLASRAKLIRRDRATDFKHGMPKLGGTVYLTAADAGGGMVSYIQSCYTGFGSGIVVPGTGISLQNRGCCFTLEDGHPNAPGPSKRPYHTIIPGFVTAPGWDGEAAPLMSFGVMGGYMQPQGHAQVMVRIADFGQNPQAALDAPRWRVDDGLTVNIEPGFDETVYKGLADLGHEVVRAEARTVAHGRGQIIYALEDGYLAASDLRSDGQAVGF
ncbi:MAG: gamma-glutamyltransferase family protein [Phycisphaeraceae bacterium]|nr:MAG: gamma-glutamyltransferase family protein [Phycisphaeraceae bacterium]